MPTSDSHLTATSPRRSASTITSATRFSSAASAPATPAACQTCAIFDAAVAGRRVVITAAIGRPAARSKEVARTLGLLPQRPLAPEGIAVADLVGRGRHPHQKMLARWSPRDYEAVSDALAATGISDLAERSVDELSGGQQQRVWIAMALAQETDILLLDEPTTFLDVTHQIEVLDLLTDLNRTRGTTIVMVLHDLNLAARYADELVAVRDGHVHAIGGPAEVITEVLVREVFGLESLVIDDPLTGKPMVLPSGRHHVRAGS
ncbi:ABC transporter ATP-binding protein [Cryobacterium sp. 1639]|nr:ABC transporter ATP-binding protein [Cryobacterium sp. 1639]